MPNAFEEVANLIFGRPAGPPDPLDPTTFPRPAAQSGTLMGFLDTVWGRPVAKQIAQANIAAGREERDGVRSAAAEKAAKEQADAEALASRYQELLAQAGGDSNAAVKRLIQDPAFSRAFASGSIDRLVATIKNTTAQPDPGAAVRAGLSGQGALSPGVAAGGMDVDRNRTASPLADTLGLDPAQSEALRQSSQLNPAGTANTVATQLQARAFPTPEVAPARNTALDREAAKRLRELQEDGDAATMELTTLTQLGQSLQTNPGGFATGLRGMAARWGITTGRNVTDLQVAQAMLDRLTPAQRQGLPGAASDRDVALFRGSLPSLFQTPEGQRQIMDTLTALAQHRSARGRIASQAIEQGGGIQDAFAAIRSLPDPFRALNDRRDAQLGATEGIDFTAVPRMTRHELRAFNQQMVEHYGGPQNIPARVKAILKRRAEQIDAAGR